MRVRLLLVLAIALPACTGSSTGDSSPSGPATETDTDTDVDADADADSDVDTDTDADTDPVDPGGLLLEVQGLTGEAREITRFRATRFEVPYSDWLAVGWSASDVPSRHDGFEIEAPCDAALWDEVASWSGPRAGAITEVQAGGALGGTLSFFDADVAFLGACDGSDRTVIVSGRFAEVAEGARMVWDVEGIAGGLEIESLSYGGAAIETETAWEAAVIPAEGAFTVVGLCGTDAANLAYGWAPLTNWFSDSDFRAVTLSMVDPDGYFVADRVNGYDVRVTAVNGCVANVQSIELEAGTLEVF